MYRETRLPAGLESMASSQYRISLGNCTFVHCSDVADLPQAALGQEYKHAGDTCLFEVILVRYTIWPHDTQNAHEVEQRKVLSPYSLRE